MTIGELILRLQDYDEDAQVLLMTQQSYPFENTIRGVVSRTEILAGDDEDDGEEFVADGVVFIVEGYQVCYGDKRAWDAC